MEGYTVHTIERKDAIPWIMKKHYAKRMPTISKCFGIFENNLIFGVCTFGVPATPYVGKSIIGQDKAYLVLELNRLCIEDSAPKNTASFFISQCIKQIEKPKIIVSYADSGQNHVGYIYQATNFFYTGLSDKHRFWHSENINKHCRTIGNEVRKGLNKYNDIEFKEYDRKHRYLYFHASKKDKKNLLSELKQKILPYPKGESKRYDASEEFPKQVQMFG